MTKKTTMTVVMTVTIIIAVVGLFAVIPTQQADAQQQSRNTNDPLLNAILTGIQIIMADIANLSIDVNNISTTGSNHTESFDALTTEHSELSMDVTTLTYNQSTEFEMTNENISTLNTEISDLGTEVSELSTEITLLTDSVTIQSEEITTLAGTQMNNVKTHYASMQGSVFIDSTYGYTGTVCMTDTDLSNGGWLVVKRGTFTEHSIFPTEEWIEYCANIGSEGGETLTIVFIPSNVGDSNNFVYGNITIVGQANDPTLAITT